MKRFIKRDGRVHPLGLVIPTILLMLLSLTLFPVFKVYANEVDRCESHSEKEPALCSYEPNTIGFTKDSDDRWFMDFKVSLRYQMFPDWITRGLNHVKDGFGNDTALYFAFSGRLGQYIVTRDSAPVVGKRFNPKLFFRYWYDEGHREYIDFAFLAHESNGQSIDDPAQYQAARNSEEEPEIADDQLSRGWDYLEVVWKKTLYQAGEKRMISTFLTLKYFLNRGPFQGEPEEYNEWEGNPEGKPRDRFNGIAGMIKVLENMEWSIFKDIKIAALYETGYREVFRQSTVRAEVGTKILQLPLVLWWQTGYGSDLAQYYKKVSSGGIQVEIGSF